LKSLLLVDDQPNDLRIAADTAKELGITDIHAQTSAERARTYLEKGLEGEIALPDGIVLDLDLGYESGFELLRFWHATPRLAKIPMIVWSVLENEREICNLFNVQSFVCKWEGPNGLREALVQLAA
jgi:CheY-like chemotaxis protein